MPMWGSGKTTVLTVKIRYLHESADISYRDMVVLTFTNKAANEIKERLAASEEASNLPDMRYFGTFHSVALQLLREILPVGQLGYTADFQVMDPEEELDLALELIRERKLQIKYKNRLKKRLEQETAGSPGRNSSRIQDDMPLLQEALKEEKKKRDRMSFSDLLFNTEQLLEGTEWKPQWVIIDEVQDCDAPAAASDSKAGGQGGVSFCRWGSQSGDLQLEGEAPAMCFIPCGRLMMLWNCPCL